MKELLLALQEKYEQEKDKMIRKSDIFSKIRVGLFFLFLGFILFYGNCPHTFIIVLLIATVFLFILVMFFHNQVNKKIRKYEIDLELVEKYLIRRNDEWKTILEERIEIEDSALLDLGIFGHHSLFQFLNFTDSLGGKKRLIDTLSLKRKDIKILENQKAIEELISQLECSLVLQEKLLDIKNIDKIDFKEYFYLFEKKENSKKIETLISLFFSILTISTLLLALLHIITPTYFLGVFLFQLAASYFYQMIYKEEFDDISNGARTFGSLKEVYHYMDSLSFNAKKNQMLQEDIRKGKDTISKLDKIANWNAYRFNFITNILFNVFASLNFIILYQYTRLLEKESDTLKRSIYALEEFEVLISLSTIGIVKEEISFPSIHKEISLDIKNIKHPLLEEETCISNSFKCGQDIQIITGSNMSGKTSFMKTIGINLVLAYTGTYVNAEKFSCSMMKIFTSINVKDDISNGISTFYGELQRIKNVLDFSKNKNTPMIIFIDEIFKGTNYNDRILGAKEVLKKLSKLPCIVFLTTHDFELCEISDKKIHNYHFEETYQKNKISFDYKIKDGQCKTTNAKYLMKEIGIID